jgi:hypothetical protein
MEDDLYKYERLCVFCGGKPQGENKEHVLPQWLMALTGDPKRQVDIGFNWFTGKEMRFSLNALKFPSCQSCNDRYSQLEGIAKTIIEKVLTESTLTAYDCIYLLDWFDKLRIGLWLGFRYLNKNAFSLTPTFHIDQRIRQKDRVLAIRKLPPVSDGLNCIGGQTALFNLQPSCFSLRVNNFIFTNVSADFIISNRLGLPFQFKSIVKEDRSGFDVIMQSGTGRFKTPLFRHHFYNPEYVILQPVFSQGLCIAPDLYNNDYVKDLSYEWQNGLGKVIVETPIGFFKLELGEEIDLVFPNEPKEVTKSSLMIETLRLQNFLQDNSRVSGEQLDKDVRRVIEHALRKAYSFNTSAIKKYKKRRD